MAECNTEKEVLLTGAEDTKATQTAVHKKIITNSVKQFYSNGPETYSVLY